MAEHRRISNLRTLAYIL